jgi:hypothetical protein
VGELESRLVENVKTLLAPLFVLFDFFEVGDQIYVEIVDKFVSGQVS